MKWDVEAKAAYFSSDSRDRWNGTAGAQIIAMGKRALPFVMEEIERGEFFFNIAADRITGIPIGGSGVFVSEQERSKQWLSWWHSAVDDPRWNVFRSRR